MCRSTLYKVANFPSSVDGREEVLYVHCYFRVKLNVSKWYCLA
jgi:hypothetical protein